VKGRSAIGGEGLVVAALMLLAFLLRVPALGRSLWLDEAWRANVALASSWSEFWSRVLGSGDGGLGAPMPPIFAVALRLLGVAVGHSAAGMRVIAVGASVAAVPLAYVVGRRAAGTAAGVAAALCFTAAPAALVHGQELKQYSVDVAVVLALLLATSTVAARPADARSWVALAFTAALAPGLAYPAALVLPGVALATFAVCRTSAERRYWLAAETASALAALAWYALVIGPQRERPRVLAYWAGDFPPLDAAVGPGWYVGQLREFLVYAYGEPAVVAGVVTVVGLALAARWLGVAALVTLATAIAAAAWRVYPLSAGRTTVFLLPFVYVGLAAAVGVWDRRAPAYRVLTVAAALLLLGVVGRGLRHPTAGLVYEETVPLIAAIDAERQPNDRIYVYDGATQAFRFHHPTVDPAITLGGSHRNDPTHYAAEVHPLLAPGTRLWLLFAHVFTPANGRSERDLILADVAVYGRPLDTRETPGASLHLFEITRAPESVKHIQLTPEDLRDPERMKQLLGR
jgi:hypothetical protein